MCAAFVLRCLGPVRQQGSPFLLRMSRHWHHSPAAIRIRAYRSGGAGLL